MGFIAPLFELGNVYNFEQAFGAKDISTPTMSAAVKDWFALYYDDAATADSDPCQRIPVAMIHKLTKTVFSEYTAESGNEYAATVLAALGQVRKDAMQQALMGGQCYLKPIFSANGLSFSVIARTDYIPLGRNERGEITDVGTAERTAEERRYYTLLERRTVDANGYLTIRSRLYLSDTEGVMGREVPLGTLEKYASIAPELTLPQPIGSVGLIPVRNPSENTVDGSPDPVSVYAPAVGLIRNINSNEAQLNGEFERGKSRIFVNDSLLQRRNGRKALTDTVFVGVTGDFQENGVSIFSPNLRESSYLARKAEYLRNVESLIGLKRGLLSEVEAAERTATEITSSAGDYNLTIMDFQEMWEKAVREAVRICEVLGRIYKAYSGAAIDLAKDVTISWGNGILYDEERTWADYKAMVSAGMLKPEIAIGWYFDLPTDTEADLAKIRAKYMPVMEQLTQDGDA